jgi:hypothetical protein
MTKDEAKKVFGAAIRALPDAWKDNIRYHLKQNTPILSGKDDWMFIAGPAGKL